MDLKKLLLIMAVTIAVILGVALMGRSLIFAPAPGLTPTPNPEGEKPALEAALRAASKTDQKGIPESLIYQVTVDQVELSGDGKMALVWMGLIDPQTKKIVATEPGLAIGKRADSHSPWQITLPTGQDYLAALQGVPDALLSKQEKSIYQPAVLPDSVAGQVYTGYMLPWEAGRRVWLTGSVAHFTTYNSCSWVTVNGDYHSTCRYAFDFSDGTYFRILASKGGIVVGSRWTCVNDDHNCLNYIALQDPTTTPVTTALYLHLAQNSIPAALRVNGTYVNQGDFIGLVDNTGLSTGSHLHFMVVGNTWWGTAYGGFWWGDSVDITFSDVEINGGRPRLCSEAYYTPQYGTQCIHKNEAIGEWMDNWYVSANTGGNAPPVALMTEPAAYSTINTATTTISGSAVGGNGVSYTQAVANWNNTWVEIGSRLTSSPFTVTVDLCAAGISNGPVTLGLYSYDLDGNRSAIVQDPRPVSFNTLCTLPPPKCTPTADQVSIYSLPDYQGVCKVFGVEKYDAALFTPVGNNQAASLQVGANVMAVLYDGNYESGLLKDRSEAFLSSDPGLADNRIGIRTSSLEVKARAKPAAPLLRNVFNALGSAQKPVPPNSNESVMLVWKGADTGYPPDEGGTEYRAELTSPNGSKAASEWQVASSWSVGSLAAGAYSWTVTARNLVGETISAPAAFTVTAATALTGSALNVPYFEGFESGSLGWSATGLWRRAASPDPTKNSPWAWGFSNGTSYADALVAGGELTSPLINVPSTGAVLKFRNYSLTEASFAYWDQRRVQISANGGPFQDVLQLWDDPIGEWQSSPVISLAPYAGKTVRVRFYFHSIDNFNNGFTGWWIDDVSVAANGASPACTELTPNDTPAQAASIDFNQPVSGFICPAGDLDFYKFTAIAGTTLTANIVARLDGSGLEPYLYLLDGDGRSILAENDDIQYGVLQDPHIGYTIRRTGTYYLKVKAYNHLGVGGVEYPYRLNLKNSGTTALALSVISPVSRWVKAGIINWEVSTAGLDGITRVDFFWHSPQWRGGTWDTLSSDTDGSDGWKANVDPSLRVIEGSALLARAYDLTGQVATALVWNLRVDSALPTSALKALPAVTQSTAVTLTWTSADAASGIYHYNLQVQEGGGAWVDLVKSLPASSTQAFFKGIPGRTYGFRMRAVDQAGNEEAFPTAAEVATTLATSCTPDGNDATAPGDNVPAGAVSLVLKSSQSHNFCVLGQGGQQPAAVYGDEDWHRISVKAGDRLEVAVSPISGGAAATLAILDASGAKTLAQGDSYGLGHPATVIFTFSAAGEYLVRVRPLDAGLWGTEARYTIKLDLPEVNPRQYIPNINR